MRTRLFFFAAIGIAVSAASSRGAAQRDRHPEADEYIKLGTRVPPQAPGEGGQLFVTASRQYCDDGRYILEVNHMPSGFSGGPVLKQLAGPSACRWQFDDMPPGDYIANLTTAADDRIVATGRTRLSKKAAVAGDRRIGHRGRGDPEGQRFRAACRRSPDVQKLAARMARVGCAG
jgi:hypothetical protein